MPEYDTGTLLLVLIAILLPPLAVWMETDSIGQVLLTVLLWMLGGLPGILYALWVVLG